ncbi:MAG: hypothetical protein RIA65_01335, partial [Woeseia sp.]
MADIPCQFVFKVLADRRFNDGTVIPKRDTEPAIRLPQGLARLVVGPPHSAQSTRTLNLRFVFEQAAPEALIMIRESTFLLVFLASLLTACNADTTQAETTSAQSFDILITGGRIVDGSGAPWYR